MTDCYVIIDIATTCDENGYISKDSMEIIELSYSILCSKNLKILDSNSILIRPVNTPITPYCNSKFKINWELVRSAPTFKEAIDKFINLLNSYNSFSFISFIPNQLKVQLIREARDKSVDLPTFLQYPRIFNLSKEFENYIKKNITLESDLDSTLSDLSLESMLSTLNIDQPQDLTSSIVTQNVDLYTKILIELIKKSIPIDSYPLVLTKPYDSLQDFNAFKLEKSKILFLGNLPQDTTQSELESWFTQYGGRPIAFWCIKNEDSDDLSGFAVFATHDETIESLLMNGRSLNDKAIEVQPSSIKILENAGDLLIPFPASKNRPRPGDWTCPSCGFSNFQRRTHCFRCSFSASSAVAIQESIYPRRSNNKSDKSYYFDQSNQNQSQNQSQNHSQNYNNNNNNNNNNNRNYNNVPFRAGDWKCEVCMYHNFAKNLCCLKCSGAKPMVSTIHTVNSTAAAIAAATASGQPLNNGYIQQPQPQHAFNQRKKFSQGQPQLQQLQGQHQTQQQQQHQQQLQQGQHQQQHQQQHQHEHQHHQQQLQQQQFKINGTSSYQNQQFNNTPYQYDENSSFNVLTGQMGSMNLSQQG